MSFFTSAIDTLQILVVALGAGLGAWGVINLLEGYGNDNPGAKRQGMKQFMAKDVYKRQPPDLLEKYKEQFLAPESFARIGGKILAVKQPVPLPEDKERTQKPPHKSGPEL